MARSSLKNIVRLLDRDETKTPEKEFLADLKRSIEMESNENFRKPSQFYKPSSMNCIRNMWFQRMGIDPDPHESNYRLTGITNSGSDIHERIQGYVSRMKNYGIDCEYIDVAEFIKSRELSDIEIIGQRGFETKLRHKTLNLSFMTDGIIRYRGRYYILELKTEALSKWQDRKGTDPKHYNQATAYSIAFGLDNVIFVYINRDVLDMKAYMFKVTDDMKQELIGKITECDDYVERQILPPKPSDAGPKLCQYCNYRGKCGN